MQALMLHTYAMELSVPLVLWVIAFASLLVTVVLGAILAYHWIRYALNNVVTTLAIGIFAGVAGVLLVTMFGAATAFSI